MRWGPRAITALLALACARRAAAAAAAATTSRSSRRRRFRRDSCPCSTGRPGSGDVRCGSTAISSPSTADTPTSRDLAPERQPSDVTRSNVGRREQPLLSITVGFGDDTRLFAGDDDGQIWAIATARPSRPHLRLFADTGTQPITGLAFAPTGFGDFGGSALRGAGDGGLCASRSATRAQAGRRFGPAGELRRPRVLGHDSVRDRRQRPTRSTRSTRTEASRPLSGFTRPSESPSITTASEIYVADAGDDVLYTVPVAGGTPTARAAYYFDPDAPSGVAYDGLGALAFITTDRPRSAAPTCRGSTPRTRTSGCFRRAHGRLRRSRVRPHRRRSSSSANDHDDPRTRATREQLPVRRAARPAAAVDVLASGSRIADEELLGVAIDPVTQAIYFCAPSSGTSTGATSDGSADAARRAPRRSRACSGSSSRRRPSASFDRYDRSSRRPQTDTVFAIDPGEPEHCSRRSRDLGASPARVSAISCSRSTARSTWSTTTTTTPPARILRILTSERRASTSLAASTVAARPRRRDRDRRGRRSPARHERDRGRRSAARGAAGRDRRPR